MALGQASGADMSDSDSDDMPSLVDGSGDLSDDDVPHLSALNQERHNQQLAYVRIFLKKYTRRTTRSPHNPQQR